jgi:hypothetical protein
VLRLISRKQDGAMVGANLDLSRARQCACLESASASVPAPAPPAKPTRSSISRVARVAVPDKTQTNSERSLMSSVPTRSSVDMASVWGRNSA